jgi:hypothetical protein
MGNKTADQRSSSARSGRRSADDDQQTSLSNQNPAEGRRDLGHDLPDSADTSTGKTSQGRAPQKTKLTTDEPAEGDQESVEE